MTETATDFLTGVATPVIPPTAAPKKEVEVITTPEPPAFTQITADPDAPRATQTTTYVETALVKQMAEAARALEFMRTHLYSADGRKQYDRFRVLMQDLYLSFTAFTVSEAMRSE